MSKKENKRLMDNEKIFLELAEKRTIEKLGLDSKQINLAQAYETTKKIEFNNIKKELSQEARRELTLWSVFWKKLS